MGLPAYQELLDSKEINPVDKDNVDSNGHSSTTDVNEIAEADNDFMVMTADEDIPSEAQDNDNNVMIKQETELQSGMYIFSSSYTLSHTGTVFWFLNINREIYLI